MNTQYLNLMKDIPETKEMNVLLSLKPFVSFLEQKIKEKKNVRTPFFTYVRDRIRQFEDWDTQITEDNLEKFRDAFELVYFTLSAPVTNEKDFLWALGEPLTPHIFYGTGAFYRLLTRKDGSIRDKLLNQELLHNRALERLRIIYALVLERFYGFSYPVGNAIKISIHDDKGGLNKYYKIEFDTRFIDFSFNGTLPEIDFAYFQIIQNNETESIAYLQKVLPLNRIRFEGFSLVQIFDVTTEYAVEKIKDIIVNLAPGQKVFCRVIDSLRTLLHSKDTYLNLYPILKVNGRLVIDSLEEMETDFKEVCIRHKLSKEKYLQAIEGFSRDPRIIFITDIPQSKDIGTEWKALLQAMGIKAVAIVPIFFQKELVGILQLFSVKENALPADILSSLTPAIPLLEQLLQTTIHNFNLRIDNVIKDQFTALHPSVLWRFNEAAWNFIQHRQSGKQAVMEHVHFPDVYPLYGAIDIRNSTIERNNAVRNDMKFQLELLDKVLLKIKTGHPLHLIDEIIFKATTWRKQITEYINPEDEFRLYLFLENEAMPFLELISRRGDANAALINEYYEAIKPDGKAYANRRKLENTLQLINRIIGTELEKMNASVQEIYPCYFEKFRSDGIEYDIYIGQSITPQTPFYPFYLKNLRLVQLSSMAEIAKQTQALLPQLSKKLQTTQLIFINTNVIDISFRNDERRFDVEGGYNVRYEMMKKRIDKVHILNSKERLTQPGKIALIYFHQKDIEEYISHIHYLQKNGILQDDLEYLDLERLQGLDGLKALRVGVKI
jgi:hypothetical protein